MSEIRILGLDVGTKTIGVAVSDGLGWTARPLETIKRHSWKADLDALNKWIETYQVDTIVVGLPLDKSGEIGEQARYSQRAGERIQQEFPQVKIEYIDESLSTQESYAYFRASGMKRKKQKAMIDQQAAAIILQRYLDQNTTRQTE